MMETNYMLSKYARIVFLVLIMLSLCSCSGTKKSGGTVIRFVTMSTPTEISVITKSLAEYKKLHPEITVKAEYVDANTFFIKILTQFAGRDEPDVMFLWSSLSATFAEKGVLLDLRPLIKKYALDIEDFFPNAVKLGQEGGEQILIPREAGGMTLCFNKTLFDRAGMVYPNESWTWTEFRDAVQKLTKDTDGDGKIDQYGFTGVRPYFTWGYFVFQNGGRLLNESRTSSLMGSKEAIGAFKYLRSIQQITGYDESSSGESMTQPDMFKTNKIAMFHAMRGSVQDLMRVKSLRFGYTLLPRGKVRASLSGMGGYGIAASTKHTDECFALIKFLVDKDRQKILARETGATPSRKSCCAYWLSLYPKDIGVKAFIDSIPHGGTEFQLPRWNETIAAAQNEADLFFQLGSKVSAESTCRRIEQRMNEVLRK